MVSHGPQSRFQAEPFPEKKGSAIYPSRDIPHLAKDLRVRQGPSNGFKIIKYCIVLVTGLCYCMDNEALYYYMKIKYP